MNRTMLIDATHPEETRVVVTEKNKITEFDVESSRRKQTIGNIYLAKVTRVEPSLQAAFVEYGAGKQGFLAFSEIHPDYYQIPLEDRAALIESENARLRTLEDDDLEQDGVLEDKNEPDEALSDSDEEEDFTSASETDTPEEGDGEDSELAAENKENSPPRKSPRAKSARNAKSYRRRYKIQEVIKKRQILLVQVVKEERSNKGAALTSYLSLAGRYCVLMPNTARGGGISRKITQAQDRQRLKEIASSMDIPEGMGLIIRTAGSNRTKTELKRDFEYLLRLWDNVRELTLTSVAPSVVYEEGNLIKRALRDIYTKEVQNILIEGDEAYREAKDFMKMISPSSTRCIQHYQEKIPLFIKYQAEKQLEEFTGHIVQLRSGGYLVIDQTEALVAIDINSGRSTNEYSVEDTALKTNLEAADEIARQLRLRDLAGLIVIDFIDMEEYRNIRTVERKIREALKADKARIQIGKISAFGLMEMTRQRLRPGMHELLSSPCPHCNGSGYIPADEIAAMRVLRVIEKESALSENLLTLKARVALPVAVYLLNKKRDTLSGLEKKHGIAIEIHPDHTLFGTSCETDLIPVEGKSVRTVSETALTVKDKHETEEESAAEAENGSGRDRRRKSGDRRKRNDNRAPRNEDKAPVEQNGETDDAGKAASNASREEYHNRKRREFLNRRDRKKRAAEPKNVTPELYVTESGVEVTIESEFSVKIVEEQKNDLQTDHKEIRAKDGAETIEINGVIIENRDTVGKLNAISDETPTEKPATEDILEIAVSNGASDYQNGKAEEASNEVSESDANTPISAAEEASDTELSSSEEIHAEPEKDIPPETPAEAPEKRLGWWRSRFGL